MVLQWCRDQNNDYLYVVLTQSEPGTLFVELLDMHKQARRDFPSVDLNKIQLRQLADRRYSLELKIPSGTAIPESYEQIPMLPKIL